jgi:glycosyltransferase involved in cell wall biosynthesis
MLHVALSTSVCQRGKSGVAAYLFGLVEGLVSSCPDIRLSLFGLEEDRGLFAPWIERGAAWHGVSERWRSAVRDIVWHQVFLPRRLREIGADVVHIPSYRRILARPPCAQIVTVHDCAAFHVRGKYDAARMLYGRQVVPRLARQARRLVTVSQATARDVERFFHRPASSIDVVWNGIDHTRLRPPPAAELAAFRLRQGLDAPYFIYLARLEHPAKNHLRLIDAFEQLIASRPELPHQLVFAGADWHGAEQIHARIAASPLRQRIRATGFVSAPDLPLWYAGAALLAYPSLFEGFGLPPVEAMACGCPVVCSARGSLGEIVGDAARLVDPDSPADIAAGLSEVLAAPSAWRKRGLARASLFDWHRCARATADLYLAAARP